MKEINDSFKFKKYLQSLKANKPFDCPFLAVLPEPVLYTCEGGRKFQKGDLLCSQKPGKYGPVCDSHFCSIQKVGIHLNKERELEAFCSWNSSKFKLKIISFEPKK